MACEEPVHSQLSESPLVQGSIKWPPKIQKKFAPPQTLTEPEPRTSGPSDKWTLGQLGGHRGTNTDIEYYAQLGIRIAQNHAMWSQYSPKSEHVKN